MAFHSYTRLIRKLFNAYRFGPPSRVTGTSPWTSVDHPVSRLPPPTRRPVQARFHCGAGTETPYLAGDGNSQAHYAKGTPSHGVLFTFPSRYWYTIGLTGVFSLAGWSRRIRAGLHVSRVTQGSAMPAAASRKGLSPAMAGLSRPFRSLLAVQHRGPTTPARP